MSAVYASARKTRVQRGTIAVIMNTYKNGPLVILPALAATVALLLGSAGVVHVVGWLPNPAHAVARWVNQGPFAAAPFEAASALAAPAPDAAPPRQATEGARARRVCAECGVITSIRKIAAIGDDAGADAIRYEFTVRQEDNTQRVITDVNPSAWRLGERVIAIGGAGSLNR